MESIICKKCGSIDEYTTEQRGTHQAAVCCHCKTVIKYIAYTVQKFYFGKYKSVEVSQCLDKNYLEWFLRETKPSAAMRKAVEDQIHNLEGGQDNG